MAFYTPSGLKIRLEPKLAFTYMARLSGFYKPAEVLKMVEGLEMVPSVVIFIVAIACLYLNLTPLSVAIAVLVADVVSNYMSGMMCMILGARVLLTIQKYAKWALLYIMLAIIVFFANGWEGLLYILVALLTGTVLNFLFEHLQTKTASRKLGIPLTKSERLFLKVFLSCADKAGVSSDGALSMEEIKSQNWEQEFTLYQLSHRLVK